MVSYELVDLDPACNFHAHKTDCMSKIRRRTECQTSCRAESHGLRYPRYVQPRKSKVREKQEELGQLKFRHERNNKAL